MPTSPDQLASSTAKQRIESLLKELPYVLDNDMAEALHKHLQEARAHLDAGEVTLAFDSFYLAKREYVLARKAKRIYYTRSWTGMMAAATLLVLFLLATLLTFRYSSVFADPLLVIALIGGGIGGCTAVLIQAIDVDPQSEAVSKQPWYLMKPLLGSALGLITYLAVTSGFAVLTPDASKATPSGSAVLVLGFLAGFFESFSKGVLARAAGQFSSREESGRPSSEPPSPAGPG